MPRPEIGIIVNGKARLRYESSFRRLMQILQEKGKSFVVKETRNILEVAGLTREFLLEKIPFVLVFGGDGTLSAAAQVYIDDGVCRYPDTALVPLPFGTGNDFFQGLFPNATRDDLSWVGGKLERRLMSLGRVRDARGQVSYFLNSFSVGITASILKDYEESRFRSYFLSTLRTLPRYRALSLQSNDQRKATLLFMVCKGPRAGGGMRLHAEASHGSPQVLWVPKVSLSFALRHFPKLYGGGLTAVPSVQSFPFEALELKGEEGELLEVEMDGETYAMEGPLQLALLRDLMTIAGPF